MHIGRRLAVQDHDEMIAVCGDLKVIPLIAFDGEIAAGLCRVDDAAGVVARRLLFPDLDLVPASFVWRSIVDTAVGILTALEIEREHEILVASIR